MLDCKDIEIQADFPDEGLCTYRLPVNYIRKQISRIKNPLETIKQYKERIFRVQKENPLALSVVINQKLPDIQISGNRCCSVDISLKSKLAHSNFKSSNRFLMKNPKILPNIDKRLAYEKIRYKKIKGLNNSHDYS